LLDALPAWDAVTPNVEEDDGPGSPTGWSDLPSDGEDTFLLSPEELDEYHRESRRREIEQGREKRIRAMQEAEKGSGTKDQDGDKDNDDEDDGQGQEGDERNGKDDAWGGSDEEVRTACSHSFFHICSQAIG
jgi:hypothetical protein